MTRKPTFPSLWESGKSKLLGTGGGIRFPLLFPEGSFGMAIFYFKKPIRRFMVRPEIRRIINDIPVITPAKVVTITQRDLNSEGAYVTEDEEIIKRIRSDSQFNTSEIRELSEKDQKAVEIKKKKLKEAEEEIKALEQETKVI